MHELANNPSAMVCLTLLIPAVAEPKITDWLIDHPTWQVELSAHQVSSRGPLVRLSSIEERIEGCALRVELRLIVQRGLLSELLGELLPLMQGLDGGYWVTPLENFAAFGGSATCTTLG